MATPAAPPAQCFVCLEDAAPLLRGGCACRSMCACAPCFLKLMADSHAASAAGAIACTVCRREFSEQGVAAVCDAAARAVAALPWAAPERHDVELTVLDLMVQRSPAAGYRRTERVMQECVRELGPQHRATVRCAFKLVTNLMKQDEFVEACVLADTWEQSLFEHAHALYPDITAAVQVLGQMFHFKAQKAACLAQGASAHECASAEHEFIQACVGLFESTGSANSAFVKTLHLFAVFMANRTEEHFLQERPRTRRSHEMWLRATAVVQKAIQVSVTARGPHDPMTHDMQETLLALQQIGEEQAYQEFAL